MAEERRKLITSHADDKLRAVIGEWWTGEIITNQHIPDDSVLIIDPDALERTMFPINVFEWGGADMSGDHRPIGPITWDEALSVTGYSGRISNAERERLQPLTTAALRSAPDEVRGHS